MSDLWVQAALVLVNALVLGASVMIENVLSKIDRQGKAMRKTQTKLNSLLLVLGEDTQFIERHKGTLRHILKDDEDDDE